MRAKMASQVRSSMKILIAYDGSRCAEAAIDDLTRAGLPQKTTATVVSVAEVWLPPPNSLDVDTGIKLDPESQELIRQHLSENKRVVAEAETLANHAKTRIKQMFPNWLVSSRATYGSPAFEILILADQLEADLVVVGSHGRSALSRLFLGSVSQKVLTEARCSVRVARGRIEVDSGPERIVVGFDATSGSDATVAEVARREWDLASEVKLITATEQVVPVAISRFMSPANVSVANPSHLERCWIEKRASGSIEKLRTAGLGVDLIVTAGNPKQLIVEEAERWGADCIFVGANSSAGCFQQFLMGSTSAAIGARAHCSVEVVRSKDGPRPERRKL